MANEVIVLNSGNQIARTAMTVSASQITGTVNADFTAGIDVTNAAITGDTGLTISSGGMTITGASTINGNLDVNGTLSYIDVTNLQVADSHIFVNDGYTTASGREGGLVVNYLPTATTDTVASGGFTAGVLSTSDATVITTGSATFSATDIIMVHNAADTDNDGLFEVLSHVGTTLTIKGQLTSTVEQFSKTNFVTDATVQGGITKVNVSVMQAGTDGLWETGQGSQTGITYSDLSVAAASGWTDDGTTVRLSTSTDNVAIGTATALGKLTVDGDTDEVQLYIKGHSTQTSNLVTIEEDGGTDRFVVTTTGAAVTGTFSASGQTDFASNVDASAGLDIDADSVNFTIGASADFSATHNGTNTVFTNTTGDWIFDNTNTTGSTIFRLGTDTSATDFQIQNDSGSPRFTITGASSSATFAVDVFGPRWDANTAAALLIGDSVATSVEIADAGVTTDIQGPLTILGGLDTAGASALVLGASNATSVEIADAGVTTDIQGPVTILGGIDTAGASTMTVGAANATSVEIADAGVTTDIQGPVTIDGGLDTSTGTTMTIGAATATKVEIADTGVTTEIQGGLTLINTGLTATGLDLGGASAELGDGYTDGFWRFGETTDPTAVADKGFLYAKDTSGVTELYWRKSDGTIVGLSTTDTSVDWDDVYNNGRTAAVDAGPWVVNQSTTNGGSFDINPSLLTETAAQIDISWGAGAFTGTPGGIAINYSGMTSLSNAGDVTAINLTGETNAGAGDSVGIKIASFDSGIENSSSLTQSGTSNFSGDFQISGTATVDFATSGATTASGGGSFNFGTGTFDVDGAATFSSTITQDAASQVTLAGNLDANGGVDTDDLTASNSVDFNCTTDIDVSSASALTVGDATRDVFVVDTSGYAITFGNSADSIGMTYSLTMEDNSPSALSIADDSGQAWMVFDSSTGAEVIGIGDPTQTINPDVNFYTSGDTTFSGPVIFPSLDLANTGSTFNGITANFTCDNPNTVVQYQGVTLTTTPGEVSLGGDLTTHDNTPIGVCVDTPGAATDVRVLMVGRCKVNCRVSVTAGEKLVWATDGRVTTRANVGSGEYIAEAGFALDSSGWGLDGDPIIAWLSGAGTAGAVQAP